MESFTKPAIDVEEQLQLLKLDSALCIRTALLSLNGLRGCLNG